MSGLKYSMEIIKIKVFPWQEPRDFLGGDLDFKKGDLVVVEIDSICEVGEVKSVLSQTGTNFNEDKSYKIIRKATSKDKAIVARYNKKVKDAAGFFRKRLEALGLVMKLAGIQFSLDGSRATFAFTAEGKVDFRQLVKDLSRHFQKSVRLEQIGSRDEVRFFKEEYGICGRPLCCLKFKGALGSISTDMAKIQQMYHRGSERISGVCGRLKCCLAFEVEEYRRLLKNMPEVGERVVTPKGEGKVVNLLVLSQKVEVELKGGVRTKVPVKDIKNLG